MIHLNLILLLATVQDSCWWALVGGLEWATVRCPKKYRGRVNAARVAVECETRVCERNRMLVDMLSLPLVAAVNLGTTHWSGWNEPDDGPYWVADWDDLTIDGKHLFALLKALYPDATFVLQTWLDT